MRKKLLHVGMEVGYTGDLTVHPHDGSAFEGVVVKINRTKAVVSAKHRTIRGNGRKYYQKGQRWALPISLLTPLKAKTPKQDTSPPPPPSETPQEAIQRILTLIEGATSPSEEMVYLRELHRLTKLSSQPQASQTKD